MQFNKVAIFGKTDERLKEVRHALQHTGFTYSDNAPDLVVSYGGDGMFLIAERAFPGVPKVLVKDSKIGKKCHDMPLEHVLNKIKEGRFIVREELKLKATVNNSILTAANDIVLRNATPIHAIRFKIMLNEKQVGDEFIGDGLIIATPHGSTGYFFSATRKSFSKGIGIGFNNSVNKLKPIILHETDVIKIILTRGDAMLSSDNDPQILNLKEGSAIVIAKSNDVARIVRVQEKD